MTEFIMWALAAGCLTALMAGPMGCFLVWRRMAYVGDAMAHSALLGIALGLALGWSLSVGMLIVCLSFSVLFSWLESRTILATDTLLGILAHTLLSLGLIGMSVMHNPMHLEGLLFGDILTVSRMDVIWMCPIVLLMLAGLYWIWSDLLLMTLQPEIAAIEGVSIFKARWLFMLLMSLVIALSVQVIGILLLMALMIIPAATARFFVSSPEMMAVLAAGIGMLAVMLGILLSIYLDWPTGPSIVVVAACGFLLSNLISSVSKG